MPNKRFYQIASQCLCLENQQERKTEIAAFLAEESAIPGFLEFCSNQLILPTIYIKLLNNNLLDSVSEDLKEFLQEIYQLNCQRNERIIAQMKLIRDVLNSAQIYPIILKGLGNLLDGVYSDIGERMMSDIDFVVSDKDYIQAAKLLEDFGYQKFSEIADYDDVMEMKHYPKLYHKEFPAVVEIHRLPVDEQFSAWFNYEQIARDKKSLDLVPGCFVESDANKIVHNFIHCQLADQGFLYGKLPLREIYDLYLFSKRVDIFSVLPRIREDRIAIAYFGMMGEITAAYKTTQDHHNIQYKLLKSKHILNLTSPLTYHFFRGVVFVFRQVFVGYLWKIIVLPFSPKMRKSLYRRISCKQWYIDHIDRYRRYLVRKDKLY